MAGIGPQPENREWEDSTWFAFLLVAAWIGLALIAC